MQYVSIKCICKLSIILNIINELQSEMIFQLFFKVTNLISRMLSVLRHIVYNVKVFTKIRIDCRSYFDSLLRAVERVTLLRFLFGMHLYYPTLDFAFFILE